MGCRYKVFELDSWAKRRVSLLGCVGYEIDPIFNRYGMYIDRKEKICWLETEFGSFDYSHRLRSVLYELKLLNHRPLRDSSRKALLDLIRDRVASKDMKQLYYFDNDWRSIRNRGRMARKTAIRLKKQVLIKRAMKHL